jgi:NAD(P)-dependent dehydrogenase (short-subunit alcohol dehydrogenase family)
LRHEKLGRSGLWVSELCLGGMLLGEQSARGMPPEVAKAYGQSKLANGLFTYELARRLEGTGVSANCLHPGAGVRTNLGCGVSGVFRPRSSLGGDKGRQPQTSTHRDASPR